MLWCGRRYGVDNMSVDSDEDGIERVIACTDVAKAFHSAAGDVIALRGVTLEVMRGEFVCLVGPSGSGKTTLLDIIGGLLRPTTGRVEVGGVVLTDVGPAELSAMRRYAIGHVLQEFGLIQHLTALENIELPLWFVTTPKSRSVVAEDALRIVGLGRRGGHYPHQLSAGERQRVAIARAIVLDPTVLLADEPTANLDSANATVVCDLLREICRRGAAVVCATHDARVVERADRILTLSDGVIGT